MKGKDFVVDYFYLAQKLLHRNFFNKKPKEDYQRESLDRILSD